MLDADAAVLGAVPAEMREQGGLGDGDRRLWRAGLDASRKREPTGQQVTDHHGLAHVARVLELAAKAVGERRQIAIADRGCAALHEVVHRRQIPGKPQAQTGLPRSGDEL